jgi:beta-glucosidase
MCCCKCFLAVAVVSAAIWTGVLIFPQGKAELPIYQDSSQSTERRVEDLLGRMTLKEKLGQLNQPTINAEAFGRERDGKLEACRRFVAGTLTDQIGPGGGLFSLAEVFANGDARGMATLSNELQKIALQRTRLKIPLLETEEGTHGALFSGATVFPEGLAVGSSWDTDLVEAIYSAAAAEARSVGMHQLCTLVIEPNRDPRLGRNAEGFSEDPYLCGRIAQAIVHGGQGNSVAAHDKVVTILCHYPGQSQGVSGLEYGAMEISERMLREVFLVPWVEGIKKAGALGVMATYPEIDDVPTHGSEKLLTQILRQELGFQGLVLSEGHGFATLLREDIVTTQKDAGALALRAGVDISSAYEDAYMQPMIDNVEEGRVCIETVDRSVRRVLEQKCRLGLFDHPYVDPEVAARTVHCKAHQDLALRDAREGIVLLKNENGVLPLRKTVGRIAVIGPDADNVYNQLGDYTPANVPQHVVTVLEGIKGKLAAGAKVSYVKGCDVMGGDSSGFQAAAQAAKEAQVAIVVVGEQYTRHTGRDRNKWPTDGEKYDVASLDLTGVQEDLIKAVRATGTLTVVVLINGRPLTTRWTAEHVPAIVEAWFPGEQGGQAVADVLFGDYNPSGRLAITIPRHVGQLPDYYDYKPSKAYRISDHDGEHYVDMPATPLFPFGFGLSYTRFEYSNLRISAQQIRPAANVQVSVDIRNAGDREGVETAQLYVHRITGSVATPIEQLRGFKRVDLKPSEKTTVRFTLTPEDFRLLNQDMHWVVEPGVIDIMLGSSSADIRLKGQVEVKD